MSVITPGELAKDQLITILFAVPKEIALPTDDFLGVKTLSVADKSLQGDVLKIRATQLPYIVVDRMKTATVSDDYVKGVTLDTRDYTFIELSKEFVEAKLGKTGSIGFQ